MHLILFIRTSLFIRWFCFNGYFLIVILLPFVLVVLNYNVFSSVAHSLKKSGRAWRNIGNTKVQSNGTVSFSVFQLLVSLHLADQIQQDPVPLFCPLDLAKV